jgi:uncharacterized protein
MAALDPVLSRKREAILATVERHRARNPRLFGSLARGEAGPHSDIDLLVDPQPGFSLFDHAALIADLEELLGRTVDVVPEPGLHPALRHRVLREAVPI